MSKFIQIEQEHNRDLFPLGTSVNAEPKDGDFNHAFTGEVVGYKDQYIQVRDQDGDVFDCDADQLSHNTDEIMHD